jgi:hypothetical protein
MFRILTANLSVGSTLQAYLATDEEHLEHLIGEGAVPIITEILNRHMAHASSVSSALLMLSLLALVEPGADAISDEAATMDAVCEALWTQRNNEDLLSSEQITEAIEVLVPDEYVSPTLEELFNTIVDVQVHPTHHIAHPICSILSYTPHHTHYIAYMFNTIIHTTPTIHTIWPYTHICVIPMTVP